MMLQTGEKQFGLDLTMMSDSVKPKSDPESHGLTSNLGFFDTPSPGSVLQVSKKWHEGSHFYLELLEAGSGERREFALGWLVNLAGEAMVILEYPPPIAGELDEPVYMVARVAGDDKFQVIDRQSLCDVTERCVAEMSRVPCTAPDELIAKLGHFPTWNELK